MENIQKKIFSSNWFIDFTSFFCLNFFKFSCPLCKKYTKKPDGSNTKYVPKCHLTFSNWPPSQNVTVDKFQNTSIPSSWPATILLRCTLSFRDTLVPFWSLRETFQIQRKMEKKEDLEATQRATVFCLLPSSQWMVFWPQSHTCFLVGTKKIWNKNI